MNCPHQKSFMPPCDIIDHPDQCNIEYCRVCGEWRDRNTIGNEFPNLFGFALAVMITMMLMTSMMNQRERSPLEQLPRYRYPTQRLSPSK